MFWPPKAVCHLIFRSLWQMNECNNSCMYTRNISRINRLLTHNQTTPFQRNSLLLKTCTDLQLFFLQGLCVCPRCVCTSYLEHFLVDSIPPGQQCAVFCDEQVFSFRAQTDNPLQWAKQDDVCICEHWPEHKLCWRQKRHWVVRRKWRSFVDIYFSSTTKEKDMKSVVPFCPFARNKL